MSCYLLLHGAWHGAWCWEKIAPLLRQAGHTVLVPDLPGHGKDTTPRSMITQDTYQAAIAALLQHCHEPVIIVGHSLSGCLISQLATLYTQKVAKLIYIAAFVPAVGESALSLLSAQQATAFSQKMLILPNENAVTFPFDLLRRFAYHQMDPQQFAALKPRFCIDPLAPWQTPLPPTSHVYAQLPKTYIACRYDRTLPWATQKQFAQKSGSVFYSLPTDHSPFYSDPMGLADLLL